jgi:hypothetical protein
MNLGTLENIIRPPRQPLESGESIGWDVIEKQLGTKLPEDYKKFIRYYGTGSINEFLFVLNPFSVNRHVNLVERGQVEREAFQTSKANFPKYYFDEIFPNIGGLLPFGITDNGEVLYWRTAGRVEHWTVTVYESRGPGHINYGIDMTSFLRGMLSGTIDCKLLPNSFFKAIPTFRVIQLP